MWQDCSSKALRGHCVKLWNWSLCCLRDLRMLKDASLGYLPWRASYWAVASCDGLIENGQHRLLCLNTWSTVGTAVWLEVWSCAGSYVTRNGLWISKDWHHSQLSATCLQIKLWALSCSAAMPPCCLPHCDGCELLSFWNCWSPKETHSPVSCLGHDGLSQQWDRRVASMLAFCFYEESTKIY